MQNKLTAIAIKAASPGKLQDGGGLVLVKSVDSGKWIYRYSHLGRRREMGLGSWPIVSLAEARKARDRWAAHLAAGRDPITTRDAERQAEIDDRDREDPTFAEAVTIVFEARKDGLRGGGERGRWRSPLDLHVIPQIGRKRLSELHQTDIRDALKPIWRKMPPTAEKAFERIRIVLRECRLIGYDCDPFIADAARRMLGEVRHVVKHITATPWQEIPALYARLPHSATGDCLRLIMLTLVRMEAARGAEHSERDDDVWTVPAERIKGREGAVKDFRVPLSGEAMKVWDAASSYGERFMFQGPTGAPVSNVAVEKVLRALGEAGTPHGMRTSFRTWVQDTDACSYEVAETVLGHTIGGKVERTYARSDLLERRRIALEAWADHVTGRAASVVRLRG